MKNKEKKMKIKIKIKNNENSKIENNKIDNYRDKKSLTI